MEEEEALGVGAVSGDDGAAAGGQLVDDGAVEVGIEGHGQCAGDRRGSHHQHMGRYAALAPELGTLLDAEAVLFVDDHIAQLCELDVGLYKGVGADEYVDAAFGKALLDFLLLAGLERADEQFDVDIESSQHLLEVGKMLGGENLGRSHEACLAAVVECDEDGEERHEGLAASDVALEQTVHLAAAAHVGAYLFDDPFLCAGEGEGEVVAVEVVEVVAYHAEDPSDGVELTCESAVLVFELVEEELLIFFAEDGLLPCLHGVGVVHVA